MTYVTYVSWTYELGIPSSELSFFLQNPKYPKILEDRWGYVIVIIVIHLFVLFYFQHSEENLQELQHIEDREEQDIARNLLKIARRFDRAQSEIDASNPAASKVLTTSGTISLPSGTFSQFLPGAQDHETASANLLRTLNTVTQEDEDIKKNLRHGAVSELNRYWSMKQIKEVCRVSNSANQSDFHSMREKGMFFCGYQDISMKKQGLPSVFMAEGDLLVVSHFWAFLFTHPQGMNDCLISQWLPHGNLP